MEAGHGQIFRKGKGASGKGIKNCGTGGKGIMTVQGTQEIQQMLGQIVRRLDNPEPVFREIGEILHESVMTNFEKGGRPKWKDLRPSTKRQRAEQNKWPGQILVRKGMSGGLMSGINYRTSGKGVILSANKKHSALHHFGASKGQFGTVIANVSEHTRTKGGKTQTVKAHTRRMKVPWGNIPARQFMMIQTDDIDEIRAVLSRHLSGEQA